MDYGKLFHNENAFRRETLEARMLDYGFKNIAKMELFLWDLELYLQIQKRLGERVVLKGGAATQFYLPKEAQRTSIDIDMIFAGTENEINKTLAQIEDDLGEEGYLHFKPHIPKNPKTTLPLFTYFTNVPSVLAESERYSRKENVLGQELKVEFIAQSMPEYSVVTGENIFAVCSEHKYQILPLDALFADKLTTIGSETIGVQNDRMDEQVKQFYDVMMLIKYCRESMNPSVIWGRYKARAEAEWNDRAKSDSNRNKIKGQEYSLDSVIKDVKRQLHRYELAAYGEDEELKKAINDFKSVYLNSSIKYSVSDVSCGASLIRIMYELLVLESGWSRVEDLFYIENLLRFDKLTGKEKGMKEREARTMLIEKFGDASAVPANILKGKNTQRVFWAVVTLENIDAIKEAVD